MTDHGALSIVIDIKADQLQNLRNRLKEVEDGGVETNSIIPYGKLSTIHFSRFVAFDGGIDAYGDPFPPRLTFTTNYDKPTDNHINELIEHAGEGLWSIFQYGVDFPNGETYSKTTLLNYLHKNTVKTNTFYAGVGKRSVQQIKQERDLRELIEDFVDSQRLQLKGKDTVQIREKIIDYVHRKPDFEWAKTPPSKRTLGQNISFWGKLVFVVLIVLALLPIIIPFVIIWMLFVLINEIRTKDVVCQIDKNHVRTLVERENTIVQQQFSAMGNIKPSFVRKSTMLFLLKTTDFLAPYLFSKGKLSGIPTVQFARWIIVNDAKQMIFLSNFDGNSENYLRDFINIAGRQLGLMFCHTVGYPKTRLMVFGGAKDAEGFMGWARSYQTISDVWYSANKDVTVKNIFNNSAIRNGLYGRMTRKQAQEWLNKI